MVSTVLFVSGVTTLLHTSFGSRLPLIQGSSFVYLAPALAIINSPEFLALEGNVCFTLLLAMLSDNTLRASMCICRSGISRNPVEWQIFFSSNKNEVYWFGYCIML